MSKLCAGSGGATTDVRRFWRHAAVATAARLLLAASDWAPVLQRRIEVATPANSLLRFRYPSLSPLQQQLIMNRSDMFRPSCCTWWRVVYQHAREIQVRVGQPLCAHAASTASMQSPHLKLRQNLASVQAPAESSPAQPREKRLVTVGTTVSAYVLSAYIMSLLSDLTAQGIPTTHKCGGVQHLWRCAERRSSSSPSARACHESALWTLHRDGIQA